MIETTQHSLSNHLIQDVGLLPTDSVFVFSSLRGFGKMEYGANGVLDVLEDILDKGCLFFPTFSYSWCDGVDFDPHLTTAPLMGEIAENTISRKGYSRTNHPNFSVNVRCRTPKISIDLKTGLDAFGEGSIFQILYKQYPSTKILLLGGVFPDSLYRSTFIHTAQQLEGAWYRYLKKIPSPNNAEIHATQLVRYLSQEEYVRHRGKMAKNISMQFPIVEDFTSYGESLLKRNLINLIPFGYSKTRLVTVEDTIDVFREGLREEMNFGLKIES
jgi:aminoglycoside N3'-acetyltransferase